MSTYFLRTSLLKIRREGIYAALVDGRLVTLDFFFCDFFSNVWGWFIDCVPDDEGRWKMSTEQKLELINKSNYTFPWLIFKLIMEGYTQFMGIKPFLTFLKEVNNCRRIFWLLIIIRTTNHSSSSLPFLSWSYQLIIISPPQLKSLLSQKTIPFTDTVSSCTL